MNKSLLYQTGKTPDGHPLIGGIFKLQDQEGTPVHLAFELCNENGWRIDWLEALADCWLNDCQKFDSLVSQAQLLVPEINLRSMFLLSVSKVCDPDVPDSHLMFTACRDILKQKRGQS